MSENNAKVNQGNVYTQQSSLHVLIMPAGLVTSTGDFSVYTMWTMKCHEGL